VGVGTGVGVGAGVGVTVAIGADVGTGVEMAIAVGVGAGVGVGVGAGVGVGVGVDVGTRVGTGVDVGAAGAAGAVGAAAGIGSGVGVAVAVGIGVDVGLGVGGGGAVGVGGTVAMGAGAVLGVGVSTSTGVGIDAVGDAVGRLTCVTLSSPALQAAANIPIANTTGRSTAKPRREIMRSTGRIALRPEGASNGRSRECRSGSAGQMYQGALSDTHYEGIQEGAESPHVPCRDTSRNQGEVDATASCTEIFLNLDAADKVRNALFPGGLFSCPA